MYAMGRTRDDGVYKGLGVSYKAGYVAVESKALESGEQGPINSRCFSHATEGLEKMQLQSF